MREVSTAELRVCEMLAPLLRSHTLHEAIIPTEGNYVFSSLEFFLTEVLREIHAEWRNESLDGIYPDRFRKIGEREVVLVGNVIFISDQTLAPFCVQLQVSSSYDEVSWIDLKFGERIGDRCNRVPYSSSKSYGTLKRISKIDWFYHVGYGERES
ncbi:MAG: hypothetical protein AAGD11_18940 [Planctomycetota bacterium]